MSETRPSPTQIPLLYVQNHLLGCGRILGVPDALGKPQDRHGNTWRLQLTGTRRDPDTAEPLLSGWFTLFQGPGFAQPGLPGVWATVNACKEVAESGRENVSLMMTKEVERSRGKFSTVREVLQPPMGKSKVLSWDQGPCPLSAFLGNSGPHEPASFLSSESGFHACSRLSF